MWRRPLSKIVRGKCRETFKSSLRSRYWPSRTLRTPRHVGGAPHSSKFFCLAHRAPWHHDVCRAVSNCLHYRVAGVGACPTTLITMSQPVYVCESPADVKRKLEAVK